MKQLLEQNWPFVYLPPEGVTTLIDGTHTHHAAPNTCLLEANESRSDAIFIIQGTLELYTYKESGRRFFSEVKGGTLLGEAAALLNIPNPIQAVCTTNVSYIRISRQMLQDLCRQYPSMAQSIANNLRERQGIFAALNRFMIQMDAAVMNGIIHLEQFLPYYKATTPALHPQINSEVLDFGAWSYAINRLPSDCTQTFVYLLSHGLPELLQDMNQRPIKTRSRRRQAWNIAPGKTLVALRDAKTDLADFVTCLSVHAIESQKLRRLFRSSGMVRALFDLDLNDPTAYQNTIDGLPLSQEEWEGVQRLWPKEPLEHLRNIIVHHEDYLLYIEQDLTSYDSNAAEMWIQSLRQSLELIDHNWRSRPVHIISSNTYGVRRCLSSAVHKRHQEIEDWGRAHRPDIMAGHFANPTDRLYALIDPFLEKHPAIKTMIDSEDRTSGIHHISNSSFTGISVDIIDMQKIRDTKLDPSLPTPNDNDLIINIDYAFGKQAEDIMGCLCLLFGQQLRSINVMGKAGALMGERGDILLANQLVMEREDDGHRLNPIGVNAQELAATSGRSVHSGTVLTVYGTLLQNRPLLEYYKSFWECVGLEMEGSFYARQIQRAQHHGVVPEDIPLRFIYYVSDLPLAEGEQLSKDMAIWEFISPLYAITRHFLKAIMEPK